MPELPEVEAARRLAERTARGRTITRVVCADDRIVFEGVAPRTVRRRLEGRRVLEVRRRGKHLWLELDRPPHPLLHFGMAGALRTRDAKPLVLASSARAVDAAWPPRWAKLHLAFDDGAELVMTDKRRLGRIRLREDPAGEPPIARLGFDPLFDPPSAADFARTLRARDAVVKGVLLDQTFAAGVGNWIADEVLYQARIDPRRPAASLTAVEARRLHGALLRIIRRAVAVDADKDRFPRSWLFHHRWGRKAGARTAKGERIEFVVVAGRTTAFVRGVQR